MKKTKIAILGSSGMLGSAVSKYFLENKSYETFCSYRNESYKFGDKYFYFDALSPDFDNIPNECEYVLNCIGIIKPYMSNSLANNIHINAIFPRRLADFCEKANKRLIHITTDCVFSGRDGEYDERSPHDCLDSYGKSKSLGEPLNCMVLRTSIIGEEMHSGVSLIEWAKKNKNKQVNGFVNHLWNGVTTKQYADICHQIIENNLFENELYHVFSPTTVTKYNLLQYVNKRFDLGLQVSEYEASESCDRSLSSQKTLNSKLFIKEIEQQIKEI